MFVSGIISLFLAVAVGARRKSVFTPSSCLNPLAPHCYPHPYPHQTPFILLHFLKIREHGVVSRASSNSVRNLAENGHHCRAEPASSSEPVARTVW